jgi:hypothetical protein
MGKPAWLDKKDNPRKFSQRREKKIAKKMGGKLTANSGARWHSKGDIKTEDSLVEVKSTAGATMAIHKSWLEKIRDEAIKAGKDPVVVLDFGNVMLIGNVILAKE